MRFLFFFFARIRTSPIPFKECQRLRFAPSHPESVAFAGTGIPCIAAARASPPKDFSYLSSVSSKVFPRGASFERCSSLLLLPRLDSLSSHRKVVPMTSVRFMSIAGEKFDGWYSIDVERAFWSILPTTGPVLLAPSIPNDRILGYHTQINC